MGLCASTAPGDGGADAGLEGAVKNGTAVPPTPRQEREAAAAGKVDPASGLMSRRQSASDERTGLAATRGVLSLSERLAADERDFASTDGKEEDDEVGELITRKADRQLSLPRYGADEDLKRQQYQARHGKRNSIVEYVESVRKMQAEQIDFLFKKRTGTIGVGVQNVKFLPRGGTYVQTSAGPVQFGMPPETIKDSMEMGLTLPTHYVLPKERFNLQTGINVAEFEFPAYFSFFVQRKKVNLVVARDVEAKIRTIFQETLLGPLRIKEPEGYSDAVPREAYPDLAAESEHFAKDPFTGAQLTIDTLLQFTYFDDDGVARIGDSVCIYDEGDTYRVTDGGEDVASVSGAVILSPPPLQARPKKWRRKRPSSSPSGQEIRAAYSRDTQSPRRQHEEDDRWVAVELGDDEDESNVCFVPPMFGITMLGAGHGFDPTSSTTGFILWMNRRGIVVDPPPHSNAILKMLGVPSRLIHGIVLTHCHADHDAGCFQALLEEGKLEVFTTEVIMGSFLRKYSAISGLSAQFISQLFEYRPVVVGDLINVYGGQLQFHYSLHMIPCIGFSAFCGGRSMVYSADTMNDPEGIEKFVAAGVMTPERRDSLVNFPWRERDVILHEAGVPPVHTPMSMLVALPDDVKERLYVVHVAAKDIPEGSGLKMPGIGPENTIIISSRRGPEHYAAEILDLVSKIDLFANFPIDRATEIIHAGRWVRYDEGAVLIEQGTMGDTLYVIAMGVVSVDVDGELVKTLTVGDHMGEMSLITQQPRTATISALTEVELVEFTGREFKHLVRNTTAIERLRHLGLMQRERSWQAICCNSVLKRLSSAQKTYLQSILRRHESVRGDVLWTAKDQAKIAVLIEKGKFIFARAKTSSPFERGAFVGEMSALLYGSPLRTTLVCAQDGSFFYVYKRDLVKFFDDNPGVLVYFQDRRFGTE